MSVELPPEDQGHDSTGQVGTVYQNDSEDPVNLTGGGTTGLRPEQGSLNTDYGYQGNNLVEKKKSNLVPIALALVIAKYTGVV